MKRAIGFFVGILLLAVGIVFLKTGTWSAYYQNKSCRPTRPLLVKAITMMPSSYSGQKRIAIDFGCGIGNETLYLLRKGYDVVAIDKQSIALKMLHNRKEFQPHLDHLKTIKKSFSNLDWKELPNVEVFLASYAMPFVSPKEFQETWREIVSHIKSGGVFIGEFFDPEYQGFSKRTRHSMSFHTKSQVENFFKDFDVKYFNEVDKPGLSGTGIGGRSKFYEVIAIKK